MLTEDDALPDGSVDLNAENLGNLVLKRLPQVDARCALSPRRAALPLLGYQPIWAPRHACVASKLLTCNFFVIKLPSPRRPSSRSTRFDRSFGSAPSVDPERARAM